MNIYIVNDLYQHTLTNWNYRLQLAFEDLPIGDDLRKYWDVDFPEDQIFQNNISFQKWRHIRDDPDKIIAGTRWSFFKYITLYDNLFRHDCAYLRNKWNQNMGYFRNWKSVADTLYHYLDDCRAHHCSEFESLIDGQSDSEEIFTKINDFFEHGFRDSLEFFECLQKYDDLAHQYMTYLEYQGELISMGDTFYHNYAHLTFHREETPRLMLG